MPRSIRGIFFAKNASRNASRFELRRNSKAAFPPDNKDGNAAFIITTETLLLYDSRFFNAPHSNDFFSSYNIPIASIGVSVFTSSAFILSETLSAARSSSVMLSS